MESCLGSTVEQLLYCEITDFGFLEPSLRLDDDVKLLPGVDKAEVSHHLSLHGQLRVAFSHLQLEWVNFSPCCDQCLTKSAQGMQALVFIICDSSATTGREVWAAWEWGHSVAAARKQREMEVDVPITFSFLFSLWGQTQNGTKLPQHGSAAFS